MSFENGTLIRWNDDKGFGFIKPDSENAQVFVHIKAFGHLARRPREGDRVFFDTIIGEQGKRRAKIAHIVDDPAVRSGSPARATSNRAQPHPLQSSSSTPCSRRPANTYRRARRSIGTYMLLIVIPVAALFWGFSKLADRGTGLASQPRRSSPTATSPIFHCEGKKHCGQMDSREEAQFYLKNCPHDSMDGDDDGVACERQFGH